MAIANADGSIVLTTNVDQSGLKKGMTTMKSGVSSLIGSFGKLATAIGVAFSVGALVKFSKEASNLATKAEASVQRLIDIYGEASKAVGDFIDSNAQALGMSRAAAASYASVYGNLFSVWADQATNAELTNAYLNMTAVVASKTGRTVEDVQERIRSGLLGNTEAIEDLGVFVNVKTIEMTDAFQRMANGKSWDQLDAYTQQQIRSMAILEQATAKYGDEVAQTTALTKSQFQAAWQDFQATWGQVVNMVLTPVLEVLTNIIIKATELMQVMFNISSATISESEAISDAKENQDDLTDSVKKTEKALKRTIAGFDEIQILSSETKENEEGLSSEISMPSVDGIKKTEQVSNTPAFLSQIYEEAKRVSDLFMNGFWIGFGNADFSQPLNSIKNIGNEFTNIVKNVMPNAQEAADAIIMAFGQTAGAVGSIGKTIANNLLGGFEIYLSQNSAYITSRIGGIFDASKEVATYVGNMWSAFANIFSAFAGDNGASLTGHIIGIFSNAFLAISEISTRLGADLIGLIAIPIANNQEELKLVLDDILGFFSDTFGAIDELVKNTGEKFVGLYKDHISPVFSTISGAISEWVQTFTIAYNEHIKPVLDKFAENFNQVVNEHVSPMIDKMINFIKKFAEYITEIWNNILKPVVNWLVERFINSFGTFLSTVGDYFNTLLSSVSDVAGSLFDVFGGIIDFILGVFTGNWQRAWEGVKSIFKGIFDALVGIVKAPINLIIDAINGLISGLNKVSFDLPNWSILGDWSGKKFGINISKIPKLAQGTVVPPNREFLAILGDNKKEHEVVSPVSTIQEAVSSVVSAQNEETQYILRDILEAILGIQIGDDLIGRASQRYNNSMLKMYGG